MARKIGESNVIVLSHILYDYSVACSLGTLREFWDQLSESIGKRETVIIVLERMKSTPELLIETKGIRWYAAGVGGYV